jgi:ATP-dependent HslUV protease, peptidase subunit HslV
MTTIVTVKKNGLVAIAADTLTSYGNTKETAKYILNSGKIFKYKENYLALAGWGATQLAVENFLANTKKKLSFNNVQEIFQSGLVIHEALKGNYFLRPDDEESDPFETSHLNVLIANSYGIFSLTEHRYVQEFSKFYAYGSGADFALGAMFAIYDEENKTAEHIAKVGINAGAEFDDGTSLPMNCYTVKLK